MSDDIRPATQVPRAQAALTSGGPTVAAAYLVLDAEGDWRISDTGPADAFFDDVSGDIVINAGLSAHERFFRKINGDYRLR